MARTKQALPKRADEVRRQIERWRKAGKKRRAMPEELWAAATELAREHGVYRISKGLGVRFDTLKQRVRPRGKPGKGAKPKQVGGFVDLGPIVPMATGSVVELSDARGSKVTIRLTAQSEVDVTKLASAFWRRRGR